MIVGPACVFLCCSEDISGCRSETSDRTHGDQVVSLSPSLSSLLSASSNFKEPQVCLARALNSYNIWQWLLPPGACGEVGMILSASIWNGCKTLNQLWTSLIHWFLSACLILQGDKKNSPKKRKKSTPNKGILSYCQCAANRSCYMLHIQKTSHVIFIIMD